MKQWYARPGDRFEVAVAGLRRVLAAGLLLASLTAAVVAAEALADLLAAAKRSDGRVIFENDYVRVHNTILEYPAAQLEDKLPSQTVGCHGRQASRRAALA